MKTFIVHTRALPGCCKTGDAPSVVEIEGEVILAVEDPSIMWLPEGEFKFRVMAPEALYEPQEVKQADGSKKKVMVPTVYHSHAIYQSAAEAQLAAEKMVQMSLDFDVRKGRISSYTEEELKSKLAEIQTIMLP
jgi:hypothetical protein